MNGIELIAKERERQITEEGWTEEHDDEHKDEELAWAAICYAAPAEILAERVFPCNCRSVGECPHILMGGIIKWSDPFPWSKEHDKRGKHNRLRRLVISAALIAAEIDRLQREAQRDLIQEVRHE